MTTSFLNKRMFFSVVMVLSALNTFTTQAVEFKGVVGAGYDFGGSKLGDGSWSNIFNTEIHANEGLEGHFGGVMVTGPFETQLTIGNKAMIADRGEGSTSWRSDIVNLTEFYSTGSVRMGLGISYQINPRYLVTDWPRAKNYIYDRALGAVVQIGLLNMKKTFSFDLRYTFIKYKRINAVNGPDIDGSSIGLFFSYFFPSK